MTLKKNQNKPVIHNNTKQFEILGWLAASFLPRMNELSREFVSNEKVDPKLFIRSGRKQLLYISGVSNSVVLNKK